MPVIRCERCDTSQYVAATHATVLRCARCGHQIPLSRKALIDPVIAAGVAHRVRRPSALRAVRPRPPRINPLRP